MKVFNIFTKELTFKHLRNDVPAGLVVFLVALPLCLGISLASGAPLLSGVITGIIGGIVVAILSGSEKNVSGPAAGLTVVVIDAITRLGSFEAFLLAVVLAGAIQLVMGYFKAGVINHYFPSSVIKGMLAAIGAILMLKQLPHLVGYDADHEGDMAFIQWNSENTFTAIVHAFKALHPGAVVIGIASLLVMLLWDKLPVRALRGIPAPLIVVLSGIVLGLTYAYFFPAMQLSSDMFVSIPAIDLSNTASFLMFPDLSSLSNPNVYLVAVSLAIIASLETLLSTEAIDKLDPLKRHTDSNRELKAQGVGNILAGLIGGLPMTAVIVRSSANLHAGSKTKLSAFIHGILLLISVLFLYRYMNLIPLSALAAILLVIGYKLTRVSLFKSVYRQGADLFIPFIVTFLAILFTDLLIGIAIGLGVAMLFILKKNAKYSHSVVQTPTNHEPIQIVLADQVTFLNKPKLKKTLEELPQNCEVVIDGSRSIFIDHDIIDLIHNFKEAALQKNIKVEFIGMSKAKNNRKLKLEAHA